MRALPLPVMMQGFLWVAAGLAVHHAGQTLAYIRVFRLVTVDRALDPKLGHRQ
jgi:hypothetical protein